MVNIVDALTAKPFDLKINGKSFNLDYSCTLRHEREKVPTLKVSLYNSQLRAINHVSLELAGVEIFNSAPNNDTEEIKNSAGHVTQAGIKDSDQDGIVYVDLNTLFDTRELSFTAHQRVPEIFDTEKGDTIANTNLINISEQFIISTNPFVKTAFEKAKILFGSISLIDKSSTFYIQSNKIIFINGDFKPAIELKENTNKFRVYDLHHNLDGNIMQLKAIANELIQGGDIITYKGRTYIVDEIYITVSTTLGAQAIYTCKTLELIKKELKAQGIRNANK
ncbi:hypothetical protein ABSA28_00553 [Candidatus Hepatincolaceae symbiont of Richtersius coronifer]